MSTREFYQTLFLSDDPGDEVRALRRVVLQLMISVEALREAVVRLDSSADLRKHLLTTYKESAYLSHNNAGPSPGVAKLLDRFFSPHQLRDERTLDFPEIGFLARLGLSSEDLKEYADQAEQAELFS